MARQEQQFLNAPCTLIVIGNGQPTAIAPFIRATGYRGRIFTDPELTGFKLLGFSRTIQGVLAPSSFFSGLRALGEGHRPASLQGDLLQLGGAAVIGPGPLLSYCYRSRRADDHPPLTELLKACTGAAGS
ncbi:peroxiredoxin-like family protein [Desulfogranum mediterraneum]|uniref:peroxiredoxin-like family protein n=1 Tax=Desulfogranum mediterraneum TaxID=160661 RepID=UPI0009FD336D|nr:peroxiredoxin-like family protein [Desulfogranum mediterraneum]